jgi:hypothetical protein
MMSWHSTRSSAVVVAALLLSPLWSSGSSRADGQPSIVTDPDAVVLGRTLTEWTALYLQWANATPVPPLPEGCGPTAKVGPCDNAFHDPTGEYAEAYNPGPIFLWTAAADPTPSSTACGAAPVRTVNVPVGVPILFPIGAASDTEGPDGTSPALIPPSISDFVPPHTYAEEVQKVIETSNWTDVKMSVDCNSVANLQKAVITKFSAGVVAQGSEGQVTFGPSLPVGIELFPTGIAGYWAIIEGLKPGKHAISASFSFTNKYFGCTFKAPCISAHTESICVSNNPPCM